MRIDGAERTVVAALVQVTRMLPSIELPESEESGEPGRCASPEICSRPVAGSITANLADELSQIQDEDIHHVSPMRIQDRSAARSP